MGRLKTRGEQVSGEQVSGEQACGGRASGRRHDARPRREVAASALLNWAAATTLLVGHPYGGPVGLREVFGVAAACLLPALAAASVWFASPLLHARWRWLLAVPSAVYLLTLVAAVQTWASVRQPLFARETRDAVAGAAAFAMGTVTARTLLKTAIAAAAVIAVQYLARVLSRVRLRIRPVSRRATAVSLLLLTSFAANLLSLSFGPEPSRNPFRLLSAGATRLPDITPDEFRLRSQILAMTGNVSNVRRQYESLSLSGPPTRTPDVLIVLVETLRADALSPETMPHLSAAAATGVVATDHLATGNTSDYAFFGLTYGLDATFYPFALDWTPALPTLMRQAGYALAFLGMGDFARFGWDGRRPPPGYDLFRPNHEPFYPDRDRKTVADAVALLERRGDFAAYGGRPVCVIVSLYTPHFPYPSDADRRVFQPAFDEEPSWPPNPAERTRLWNRYRNSVRTVDDLMRPLLNRDDCLTVVLGDHGETFFDDGRLLHGTALSRVQLATPLVIRGPGVDAGAVSHLTTHADLLPILLGLLGTGVDDVSALSGRPIHESGPRAVAVGNLAGDTTGLVSDSTAGPFAAEFEFSLRSGRFRFRGPAGENGDVIADATFEPAPLERLFARTLRTSLPNEKTETLLRTVLATGSEDVRLAAVRLIAVDDRLRGELRGDLRTLAKTARSGIVRDAAADAAR